MSEINYDKVFEKEFHCPKCQEVGALTKRLTFQQGGLAKFFDMDVSQYLFVSCRRCGFTEIYNTKLLEGKTEPSGEMDWLFGG